MRKSTKIWLITATCLILIGCIIFVGAMTSLKWDFRKMSTNKYETNIHEISEDFSNISINTDTADIIFALSNDGKCKVVCFEEQKTKHSVTVNEDTLTVETVNQKSWYDYIGINFSTPKITVYLPENEYSALTIKVSTGDIAISNITFNGDIITTVSTGDIEISDTECKNFSSKGSTGDILIKNVIATEKFSIKRSTGDIKFDSSDANEIFVTTDTGHVTGTFLSEKIFIANTDTGNVNVPKTTSGGRCEITTDTGDIKIKIQ